MELAVDPLREIAVSAALLALGAFFAAHKQPVAANLQMDVVFRNAGQFEGDFVGLGRGGGRRAYGRLALSFRLGRTGKVSERTTATPAVRRPRAVFRPVLPARPSGG